jgi:hypothetical protein
LRIRGISTGTYNDITTAGHYFVTIGDSDPNKPVAGYNFFLHVYEGQNGMYVRQIAYMAGNDHNETYSRAKYNDSWGSWQKLVTESDVNPIIDVSTVWDGTNHALNISTLLTTYGLGSYMIYGQGSSGHGCLLLNVWKVESGAFAYSWQKIYNNSFPTNISGGGIVYDAPTLTLESTNMGKVNNIKRISKI